MKKILLITGLLFGLAAGAQQLDTTFNTTGQSSLNYSPGANFSQGIHQQSDGKIILTSNAGGYVPSGGGNYVGYSYYATRFNIDGSIDTSYGTNGTTKYNFPYNTFNGHSEMSDSVLQADGKIIMTGYSRSEVPITGQPTRDGIALVRLDSNGQLDTTFNSSGFNVVAYPNGSMLGNALKLQSDGKIVCTARLANSSNGTGGVIIRLNSDGTLDASFGTNGILTVLGNSILDIAIDIDQKIIVQQDLPPITPFPQAGIVGQSGQAILKRYLPNGTLDSTFGTNGILICTFLDGYYQSLSEIKALSNGKYLISGNNPQTTSVEKGFIARLNSDGSLDTTFASTGFIILNDLRYPKINVKANGQYFLISNKRVVNPDFSTVNSRVMIQLNTDGSFDTSFGTNGVFIDEISSVSYNCFNFQSDNKLIIGGALIPGSGIARFDEFTLSTDKSIFSNNLKIYPNPNTGNFNIAIDENLVGAKVSVYNVLGHKVKNFSLDNVTTKQNLESGIYILEIEKDSNKTSRKLIVN